MLLRFDEGRTRMWQKSPHDDMLAADVTPEHGERVMMPRLDEPGDVLFGYSEACRSTLACDVSVPRGSIRVEGLPANVAYCP
jgi:hypothetical protein